VTTGAAHSPDPVAPRGSARWLGGLPGLFWVLWTGILINCPLAAIKLGPWPLRKVIGQLVSSNCEVGADR